MFLTCKRFLTFITFTCFSAMLSTIALKSVSKLRYSYTFAKSVSNLKSTPGSGVFNHLEVDKKWQKYWDEHGTFTSKRRVGHPKKYVLDMFPYPSGAGLHVGHPEGYTATDIMARYYRMKDYDVLHPMGWDAFGLPAEQHAINTGTHPAVTTYENIATFKRQLKSLGFSYDWTREIATTDDDYVRWTQWIFLQLFKKGLATQSEVNVNWCPALGTVLANEEVINGLSERGNHPVIRTPLRQWVLKITEYANKLEEGLKNMNWPDGTLTAQKQWIGRSEGALIRFPIIKDNSKSYIEVFTTRPDTLMGVTYVVLAPEHPFVSSLTDPSQSSNVSNYLAITASKSDLERTSTGKDRGKSGVALGTFATHPITGEKIPIWIADYVLAGYGSGAVMAVPAHDERDYEFAQQFNLPIRQVIKSANSSETQLPYVDDGFLINSNQFDGLSSEQGRNAVVKTLEAINIQSSESSLISAGRKQTSYRLRDWVFSRQRYWGEPIPIYFPVEFTGSTDSIENPITGSAHIIRYDQPIPVEESELPLKLPNMTDFQPGDDPQGCLARAKDWRYFQKNGKWFARETNTMPQWAGSCWYYLRFTDPKCQTGLTSDEGKSWLPVDLYVGGQEHAVLHLLYARFWHKVLYDIGVIDHDEPFGKLIHQGMILGSDGEKMSKSRGNVINPDDVVREYGADALRLYEMFMGPLEAVKPWQTAQLAGVVRFRDRVVSLVDSGVSDEELPESMLRDMHKTIKKVTENIEELAFNTAISTLMIYTNAIGSAYPGRQAKPKKALETLILLLSPFAPHVAEELWQRLGYSESLAYHPWPVFDESLCEDVIVTVAIQVNGKVRGAMDVSKELIEEEALRKALDLTPVQKFVQGKPIKKTFYVPGKILNILV